jgi:hypothetical protein
MKITDNFRLKTRKAIISLGIGTVIILPCIRNASAMGYYDFYDAVKYKKSYDDGQRVPDSFKSIAENSPILVWEMNRLFPLLKYEKLLVHINIYPDT